MRKLCIFLAFVLTALSVQAKGNGIPSEIFKNGKIKYEKSTNTLVLEDGFRFSLGKGLLLFNTGKDLRILLKGNGGFDHIRHLQPFMEEPFSTAIQSNILRQPFLIDTMQHLKEREKITLPRAVCTYQNIDRIQLQINSFKRLIP